jgi:hypothetical protein
VKPPRPLRIYSVAGLRNEVMLPGWQVWCCGEASHKVSCKRITRQEAEWRCLFSALSDAPRNSRVIVFHSSPRLASEFQGETDGNRVANRLRQRVRELVDERGLRVSLRWLHGSENPALSRASKLRQGDYWAVLGRASGY